MKKEVVKGLLKARMEEESLDNDTTVTIITKQGLSITICGDEDVQIYFDEESFQINDSITNLVAYSEIATITVS